VSVRQVRRYRSPWKMSPDRKMPGPVTAEINQFTTSVPVYHREAVSMTTYRPTPRISAPRSAGECCARRRGVAHAAVGLWRHRDRTEHGLLGTQPRAGLGIGHLEDRPPDSVGVRLSDDRHVNESDGTPFRPNGKRRPGRSGQPTAASRRHHFPDGLRPRHGPSLDRRSARTPGPRCGGQKADR